MKPRSNIDYLDHYARPSFLALLNKFGDVELNCAEIGVDEGLNVQNMLKVATKSKFILVDPYAPYPETAITQEDLTTRKNTMLKNISTYNGRVQFFEKHSVEVAKLFPDSSFDYIYIDGNHQYESVKQDIRAWFPKVKYKGILAGHDYFINDISRAATEELVLKYDLYLWGVGVTMSKGSPMPNSSLPYRNCLDWWVHKENWIMKEEKSA